MGRRIARVLAILRLTWTSWARRPATYVLLLSASALILAAPMMTSFSFGEEHRVAREMGLATVTLCGLFLGVWGAGGAVGEDVERRTVPTLRVRPLRPAEFLLGKFLGIVSLVLLGTAALTAVLAGSLRLQGAAAPAGPSGLILGGYLCFLQSAVLTAAAVALSARLAFASNAAVCLGLHILGHWIGALPAMLAPAGGRAEIEAVGFPAALVRWPAYGIVRILSAAVPNLDGLDIGPTLHTGTRVPYTYVVAATGYAILFAGGALAFGVAVWTRRERA